MYGGTKHIRALFRLYPALLILLALVAGLLEPLFNIMHIERAEAAEKTIDSNVSITSSVHLKSGADTVFTDDQTGYKFFVDAPGYCVYRKTTDGGETWSGTTTVDSQTDCIQITVWYDMWTPGSASSSIHIATMDSGNDDVWYNRLDTNGDTLLLGSSPVSTFTGSAQGGTSLTTGENFTSITRGTDGTLYVISNDGTGTRDSALLECTVSCQTNTNWTERTFMPLDDASDQNLLVPLTGGDIMQIQRDISLDDIRARVWDDSAGTGTAWTVIDGSATENATYDHGLAAAVSSTTPGVVYIAYSASVVTLGTDDQVRTARYNGTSWANTANATSSTARGITNVAIGIDAASDDVYVAYSARSTTTTATTSNVFWRKATSTMMNWETQVGPINASADDIYGVDMNMMSDERLFVSWYEAVPDDMYGDTIADIFPGVHASTTGTQTASTTASTTDVYIGGKFLLYNTYRNASLDVTGITLTESGSIDGSTGVSNIRLLYEMDTTAPYNCASVSYDGSEDPFGSTDTNGFSGEDGVSTFTGTTVTLSTTTALCGYVVLDVLDAAESSTTIDISIVDPSSDITVTGGTAGPTSAQNITGTTFVYNDTPTQTHFHWRNDSGSEALATSSTSGVEDTALSALQQGTPKRLRLQVSNEGSTSTGNMQYRLEYGSTTGSCAETSNWVNVGDAGGEFDMYDSSFLTNGADTTNIATSTGGVTNENTTFLTPNGGVRDTSSQTGNINLTGQQYVELEYSIIASTSAAEGNSYCFRVTNAGTPLTAYSQIARANIAADVFVTASGTQISTTNLPATNFYTGGQFVVVDNTGTRSVTDITIRENGSIDAENDLDTIRLYYDLDTSNPYDCSSESYGGGELQFGATSTGGFSSANGTSTFSDTVTISTTQSLCLYVVLDTTPTAQNGEVIDIGMENPSQNVVVSTGSVSPTIDRDFTGSTTLQGAVLTQTHYHFRNDNGTEVDATSMTSGAEDVPVTNIDLLDPVRLRLQVSNEGAITSASRAYTLEYGAKISTCSAVGSWVNVGDTGGAFDMYDSINLSNGDDTTNISTASGGVTDENTTFLTPNGAVRDTTPTLASTTLASTEYLEMEFSLAPTVSAGNNITYCFRVSTTEVELNSYLTYPELTTSPERDFEIQRGTANFSSTSTTLVAGVHYNAPSASTSAFVRITNTHHTGAGDSSNGGTQNADDVTAYIFNPSKITNSFTIQRPSTALATTTRVSWEIIEFIGTAGSDNEMIVRAQSSITYGTASTVATGTVVSGIVDDSNVVVFITGQMNPDTGTANYNTGQTTAEWDATSDRPIFRRGVAGSDAGIVSYAVVEFTGPNWQIQRSEHTYSASGVTETEPITSLNSLTRAFIHTQKRNGVNASGTDEFGHEVWLSSVGFVSYFLEAGASFPSQQTSVAWIIENIQASAGEMVVTRQPQGTSNGGSEPLSVSVPIETGYTLDDITNASVFGNSRAALTTALYPRPIAGLTIASTTHLEIWRSDTGANLTFRTEVVEWPTAGLTLRHANHQFYADNNELDPTDLWPPGGSSIGENAVIGPGDDPLGEGERLRLRMTLRVLNATLPTSTKAFKLQYAPLTTTCTAVTESSWQTMGNSASSTIWRGYSATGTTDGTPLGTNPPGGGELNISGADVAGTLEEENDSLANPYSVPEGSDIEYDWYIEQNGASAETYYCFRMVESDGTLLSGYLPYPQVRTASFTPRTQDWRWYDDAHHLTPTSSLAEVNTAPIDVASTGTLVLRITVAETKNIARDDVRFKLQYSEYADFSTSTDVLSTSTCLASTSTWCYANASGTDNGVVSSTTLPDVDTCTLGVGDGCGTYNVTPSYLTGYRHENGASAEYSFAIQSQYPRVNTVYYFRLYDLVQDIPVEVNDSESYPSLVTVGASLTFTMSTLASSTVTEGVTLNIGATATSIPYGRLTLGTDYIAGQRFSITTNAPEGYTLYMTSPSELTNSFGSIFNPVTGTNNAPSGWNTGCDVNAPGCFGYHTGDDTLADGSTRFAANDTYARFSTTTLDEVLYTGGPVTNEVVDIVYRIKARALQAAGEYTTYIRYISVPSF